MRLPGPEAVSVPSAPRPPGVPTAVDTSGLAQGVRGLAAGLQEGAANVVQIAQRQQEQQNAVDLARAEAQKTASYLDIQNQFARDTEYDTFDQRANPMLTEALGKAGDLIRDDRVRERWLAAQESSRLTNLNAITNHGYALKQEAEKVAASTALDQQAKMIVDPMVPDAVRSKAKQDIADTITVLRNSGTLTPAEAQKWRQTYVDNAETALAQNRAELDILINPQAALTGLAIPTDGSGVGLVASALTVNGQTAPMDFDLAKMTAETIGDANFPEDPKLAKVYLSDPEMLAQYTETATAMLSDRYHGDMTAVVIAADPNGGTALADEWVRSNHDESILPASVKANYRRVMSERQPSANMPALPVSASPDADISTLNTDVLQRWEQTQTAFGKQVNIISGTRDAAKNAAVGGAPKSQHLDRNAIDLDVSNLSKDERAKLIATASAMGFKGIGVYANSMHLDLGSVRAWGPTHKAASVPDWAKAAIKAHLAGESVATPGTYNGVDPDYAALSFDQRLSLANKAQNALKETNVGMRASLQTIAENAPAAIGASGTYDGRMPDAVDFVSTFGAAEGMQRFKTFQASVDVAQTEFGMRSMSNADIVNLVQASRPTSRGNDAALQQKRYDAITSAATQTLKAREADPAGYTMSVFPNVADAFKRAQDATDPAEHQRFFQAAISSMAEAQKALGLDQMELLPGNMSADVVATFKNADVPSNDRVAVVASTVFQTNDEQQQATIMHQLIKDGLAPEMTNVLDALSRGDAAGAAMMSRAIMVDPDQLKVKLPKSDDEITQRVTERIFSENQIGDILYGMSDGTPENNLRLQSDAALFDKMVKMRLIDGSAGGDLETAIDLTTKDMFGDKQAVTGNGGWLFGGGGANLKVAVGANEDVEKVRVGMTALLPDVKSALYTKMMTEASGAPVATGALAIANAGAQNYIDQVMAEGYFTNAGEGKFQFIDPFNGTAVSKADGSPLIFTMDDVKARATTAPAPRVTGFYGSFM